MNIFLAQNAQLIALMERINAKLDQRTATTFSPTPSATMPIAAPPAAPMHPAPALNMRADIVDTATTSLSLTTSERLRKDDVGIFYPDHPDDVDRTGIVHDGKLTIYSDVYAFIDGIQSLRTNYESQTTDANDLVLLKVLPKCFQGAAKEWWVTELYPKERRVALSTIRLFIEALEQRFKPPRHETLEAWNRGRYTMNTLKGKGRSSLRAYVQRQYRYAKALGIAEPPYTAIVAIWESLDFDIQFILGEPPENSTLEQFMRRIDDRINFIYNLISKHPVTGSTSAIQQVIDRVSGRTPYPQSNREHVNGDLNTNFSHDDRDDRGDNRRDRYGNTHSSARPSDLIDRCTCRYCKELLPSRTQLFKHLKKNHPRRAPRPSKHDNAVSATTTAAAPRAPSNTQANIATLLKEHPIEMRSDTDSSCEYTPMRIRVRPQPDGNDIEFVPYTSTARSIIDESILKRLEHSIEPRRCYVKGIGLKPVLSEGYATFIFYTEGLDQNGNPAIMKFTGQAWVVPDLPANCLLGTAWLYPRGASVDFGTNRITFRKIDDFSIPFEVIARAHPCYP